MQCIPVDDAAFAQLKADIEHRPRRCGYYIIDKVAVSAVPGDGPALEAFLDDVFQHFDDQKWPPASDRPDDQSWADYECSAADAQQHVVDSLVGGPQIGHVEVTIEPAEALTLWQRFEALFPESRRYYRGMGLGDIRHVFQVGVAVVGSGTAGVLWIVESD